MTNTVIEQFRGKLINKLWKSENDRLSKRTFPEVLYHLSDIEGIVGIFNKRTLWATHASSLNDKTEISYGIDVAKAHILARLHPPPNSKSTPVISLSNKYEDMLAAIFHLYRLSTKIFQLLWTQWKRCGIRFCFISAWWKRIYIPG